jgi:hypothetical protein
LIHTADKTSKLSVIVKTAPLGNARLQNECIMNQGHENSISPKLV